MKVAIAGYGLEGKASYRYWLQKGDEVTIVDENEQLSDVPSEAKTILGKDAFKQLSNFDLVVRTPPLRPERIETNGKIWSATNEFFAKCAAPIIGVTGTKGKGTTSSLIAEILKSADKTVHLVGNIGKPALGELPNIQKEDIVVFELSSFQLWDLEKSPQTAVVLMIEPDHMDVHSSMEEYVGAKAGVTLHQSENDTVVYHPTNEFSVRIAERSRGTKTKYLSEQGAHLEGDVIVIDGHIVCQKSEVGLIGAHNLENICAAVTAAWHYTQNIAAIRGAVTSFTGLPHRLEFAGEAGEVRFYDDSFSTGPGATLAALRSFSEPTVLILGGSDKGIDISPVIEGLEPGKHSVVLIGQASDKLEGLLKARSFDAYVNLGSDATMAEIVAQATKLSAPGGVILLSPAHASFDMFQSYYDRGDQFKAAVKAL